MWPLELKVSMPWRALCLGKGLHLRGALQSHPPRVLVQEKSGLTGRCSCRGASGPHLAPTSLPAPGILSGLSLIYQHLPTVLGTSLLRALGVPGGFRTGWSPERVNLDRKPELSAAVSTSGGWGRGWTLSSAPTAGVRSSHSQSVTDPAQESRTPPTAGLAGLVGGADGGWSPVPARPRPSVCISPSCVL